MTFKLQTGIITGKQLDLCIYHFRNSVSYIYLLKKNLPLLELAQPGDVFTCTIKSNSNMQEDKDKIVFVMMKPKAFIFVQLKCHLEIA